MTDYHHVNIFVGRYRTGVMRQVGDSIGLNDARVRIIRGIERPDGFVSDPGGDPWLIIEHGDFWPVMVRLESEDIAELASLAGIVTFSGTDSQTYTFTVPS